jgi:hypothetical protein
LSSNFLTVLFFVGDIPAFLATLEVEIAALKL